MSAPALAPRVVRFDVFELDRRSGVLRKAGERLGLQQQPLQVLSVLIEQPGDVVTRDELRRRLWPEDTFVDFEHGLNAAVKRLRDALGDSAESPRFIETVPRRGYRFIAPVTFDVPNAPPGVAAPPVQVPDSRAKHRWLVAAAFIAAAGILFIYVSQVRPGDRPTPIRFEVALPAGVTLRAELGLAGVSPDGRSLAFVASAADAPPELWVRSLDTGVLRPLAGTEGALDPFWAPSGQQLGFFADGRLKTVDLAGSPPRDICETEDSTGGSWAPDDTIVFATGSRSALYRVAAAGGLPTPLTSLDPARRDITHRYPLVLPDGRHVLYLVWSGDSDRQGIMIATMDGHEVGRLLPDQSPVAFAAGHLLFVRRETLVAQAFDPQSLRLSGEAFTVEPRVGRSQRDSSPFTASARGALAFSHSSEDMRLMWVDRQGQRLAVLGEHAQFSDPAVSRDGRLVAFSQRDRARGIDNFDLWLLEDATGARRRLTFDGAVDALPVFSPDGRMLLFRSNRSGFSDLYRKRIDTDSPEELVYTSPPRKDPSDWSPDGQTLLFTQYVRRAYSDIWQLAVGPASAPQSLVEKPGRQAAARFSPDGQFIAYESSESGGPQVFVQEFGANGRRWQVTSDRGAEPQ
jgi:Tol biopolymer transport system component/DNA-binding winged helix-turn-helix (wHTH) protein